MGYAIDLITPINDMIISSPEGQSAPLQPRPFSRHRAAVRRAGLEAAEQVPFLLLRTEVRADLHRIEDRMERGLGLLHADQRDLRVRIDRITDNLALRGLIQPEGA